MPGAPFSPPPFHTPPVHQHSHHFSPRPLNPPPHPFHTRPSFPSTTVQGGGAWAAGAPERAEPRGPAACPGGAPHGQGQQVPRGGAAQGGHLGGQGAAQPQVGLQASGWKLGSRFQGGQFGPEMYARGVWKGRGGGLGGGSGRCRGTSAHKHQGHMNCTLPSSMPTGSSNPLALTTFFPPSPPPPPPLTMSPPCPQGAV